MFKKQETPKKVKVIPGQFVQGDVLLQRIPAPDLATLGQPVTKGRITLALGEVTGHSHVIVGEAVAEFALPNGQRVIWVEQPAKFAHVQGGDQPTLDHDWIDLAPAWYVYQQPQAEYEPAAQSRAIFD